jgi:excisionase family DNA binding protein
MSEIPVIWVSVDEACRISGIGRSLIYEMIKDGRLKSAKVGTKRLVSVESIRLLGDDAPVSEAITAPLKQYAKLQSLIWLPMLCQ